MNKPTEEEVKFLQKLSDNGVIQELDGYPGLFNIYGDDKVLGTAHWSAILELRNEQKL